MQSHCYITHWITVPKGRVLSRGVLPSCRLRTECEERWPQLHLHQHQGGKTQLGKKYMFLLELISRTVAYTWTLGKYKSWSKYFSWGACCNRQEEKFQCCPGCWTGWGWWGAGGAPPAWRRSWGQAAPGAGFSPSYPGTGGTTARWNSLELFFRCIKTLLTPCTVG